MDKVCGCAILSLRAEVTACAGPGTAHTGLDRQGLRLDLSPPMCAGLVRARLDRQGYGLTCHRLI